MHTLILKKLRGRFLALVTATALVVACVAVPSTPPASAQTSQTAQVAAPAAPASAAIPSSSEQICLANSSGAGACVGIPVNDIIENTIAAAGVIAAWVAIYLKWKSMGTNDGGQQGEEQETGTDGDGDADAGLCLADTGGYAFMTSCGADGTVWIAISHNDGYWLYSRYTVDEGNAEVLTSDSTASGARLFVTLSDSSPGGPWQTWNWYSTSHT
jgi:hypothetical protein